MSEYFDYYLFVVIQKAEHTMINQFQFLIYKYPSDEMSVNALIKDETIWLTQKGMAELFGVGIPAISKHLKNIFDEKELNEEVVIPKWN